MVSQDLLEILRCPVCVHNEPEGGELDHRGNWLICSDCDRKYPIRDDIPVMLVDEGDRFRELPAFELPDIPPPEKQLLAAPSVDDKAPAISEDVALYVGLGIIGLIAGLLMFLLARRLMRRQ